MSSIEVRLYCDESGGGATRSGDSIGYFGLLIVPEEKRETFSMGLLNARCIPKNKWVQGGCKKECDYHVKNNTEIHYRTLSQDHEYRIANRWIDFLLEECRDNRKMIYLNILGLNSSMINREYWNNYSKRDLKIYSKFLFTAIKSIKYFFWNADEIVIKDIIHDHSPLTGDSSVYYGKLMKDLDRDRKIELDTPEISYINSDHRDSIDLVDSHLIQFIDLVLGLTVNYIHYRSTENEKKVKLTKKISKLVRRLIHRPNNLHSRFNYVGQKRIQFFPKRENFYEEYHGLDGKETKKVKEDLFYSDRRCRFEKIHTDEEQETLEETLERVR